MSSLVVHADESRRTNDQPFVSLAERERKESGREVKGEPGSELLKLEESPKLNMGRSDEASIASKESQEDYEEVVLILSPEEKLADAFDREKSLSFTEIYTAFEAVYESKRPENKILGELELSDRELLADDRGFRENFDGELDQIGLIDSINKYNNQENTQSRTVVRVNPYLSYEHSNLENPYLRRNNAIDNAISPIEPFSPRMAEPVRDPAGSFDYDESPKTKDKIPVLFQENDLLKKFGRDAQRN